MQVRKVSRLGLKKTHGAHKTHLSSQMREALSITKYHLFCFGLDFFFFFKLGNGSSQLARTKSRECGQSQGRAETRRSGSLTPWTSQLVGGGKGEEEGSHTEPGQVGGARPAWGETRRGHQAAAASLRAARTPARAPSARRRLPVPVPVRARGGEAPQGLGTHRVPRG